MDRRTRRGVGGGGGFHVWLTRNVCHGRGLWDQKKYSISLFSVLNRVAIIFECILPLNRVRIEGFQQHNQTFFKFPPTPQGKVSFPTHNKNLAKQALQGFFF